MARRRLYRLGPWRVQLRLECNLTLEQYVTQQAWRTATLSACPLHPEGGCGFCRWGTYIRLVPIECEVVRYYCRRGHMTFSLLPDCLAARMPGTLEQVEKAATAVEHGSGSLESRADALRPPQEQADPVEIRSAVTWMRRRHRAVGTALAVLVVLVPEVFGQCMPTMASIGEALDTEVGVLVGVRRAAGELLGSIPAPIGFLHSRMGTNKGCGIAARGVVVSSVCAARSGASKGADRCQKRAETKGGVPP